MTKSNVSKQEYGYLSNTELYSNARQRLRELENLIQEKEKAVGNAPEGKIHVSRNKNNVQFYLRKDPKDKSGTYIKKKEHRIIRKYLQKAYDEKVLKLIKDEAKSIKALLKRSDNSNLKLKQIYSDYHPEIKSNIVPVDISNEDYIEMWEKEPFMGNPMPVPSTEYKSDKGEFMRSKSELTIANKLLKAGIPYKYEHPLKLKNERTIYPDFTILIVRDRREIYWEHRGKMGDLGYIDDTVLKIKEYTKNGIVVGESMFITEESSDYPLGTNEIDQVIEAIKRL